MEKEDIINILNQHGIDALCAVIEDELCKAFDAGYDLGYDDGLYNDPDYIDTTTNTYDPLMDREYNI